MRCIWIVATSMMSCSLGVVVYFFLYNYAPDLNSAVMSGSD